MRSVLACGHRLALWGYSRIEGVPEGVELRDAAEVVAEDEVFRQIPTGSYALFSNLFRYRLLQRSEGLWLDCDMYLLKPVSWGDGHVFGWERPGVVGSAVLALPPDSPVLDELIGYFAGMRIPPWLPKRWRLRFAAQRALDGRYRIETMPWGYLGPVAVTRMIEKFALAEHIKEQPILYPITYEETDLLFSDVASLEARITPATLGIHLFNEMLGRAQERVASPGSFFERLVREGA